MNTPYQRIIQNAKKGKGVRLSADETFRLSLDDAIATRAMNDTYNDKGISDEELYRDEDRGKRGLS